MIGKKKKLTIFIVLMIILTFGIGIKGKNSQVDVTPENTEIIKSKSKNEKHENTNGLHRQHLPLADGRRHCPRPAESGQARRH